MTTDQICRDAELLGRAKNRLQDFGFVRLEFEVGVIFDGKQRIGIYNPDGGPITAKPRGARNTVLIKLVARTGVEPVTLGL